MAKNHSSPGTFRKLAMESMEVLFAARRPPDLERWRLALAEDVHLRIAARPVTIGLPQAVAELDLLFRPILTFGAGFRSFWSACDDVTVFVESDMVIAAASTPLPFAGVVRTGRSHLLQDVRLYLDPAPLFLSDATI